MTRRTWWVLGLVLAVAFTGCGGEDGTGGDGDAAGGAGQPEPAGEPLATPKGSIEHQLGLLIAGKVDELKACFTPRLQDRITAEAINEAQGEVGKMTIDDLYASAKEGEYQGRKTMKVKMKNGRTLTTLVLTDGRWLADTIWFR